jgi:hypothetical protein
LAGLAAFACLPAGAVDALMFIFSLDDCLKIANKKSLSSHCWDEKL